VKEVKEEIEQQTKDPGFSLRPKENKLKIEDKKPKKSKSFC